MGSSRRSWAFPTPLPKTHQATGRFIDDFSALDLVGECACVSISWYQLVESIRPIGNFHADKLSIEPLPGASADLLRPIRRRAPPRHRPQPHEAGNFDEQSREPLEDVGADEGLSDPEDVLADDEEDAPPDADLARMLEELEGFSFAAEPDDAEGEVGEVAPGAEAIAEVAPQPVVEEVIAPAPAHEPPPPPPPPPAVAAPAHRRHATVLLQAPGGRIGYFESKRSFEAVCENRLHGRCVLTRTRQSRGLTAEGFPKAGRPVGFLAAWLASGEGLATKEEHWRASCLAPSHAERLALRQAIRDSGDAGKLILSCERPLADGEPEEPLTLEGLA